MEAPPPSWPSQPFQPGPSPLNLPSPGRPMMVAWPCRNLRDGTLQGDRLSGLEIRTNTPSIPLCVAEAVGLPSSP